MIIRTVLIGTLVAGMLLITAEAGELHVEVRRYPAVVGKVLPVVQVDEGTVKVSQVGPSKWTYSIEKQVFGTFTVVPGKDDVANYDAKPLPMKIPFTVARPVAVHLVSTKKELVSANVALDLYGTEVQKKPDSFLWQFYQRAQLQALERFSEIQSGREVNHSDIRVFFKVLEVTRELGRKRYLGISSELEGLKDYFVGIIDQPSKKNVIEKALGPNSSHFASLIEELDNLEADQYIAVWREVKAHAEKGSLQQKEACEWYRRLDKTLSELDDARAQRVLAKDNLGTLLSGAVNDCAAKAAITEFRLHGIVSPDTKEVIQRRLAETEKLVISVKVAPLQQVLRRQQKELEQALR